MEEYSLYNGAVTLWFDPDKHKYYVDDPEYGLENEYVKLSMSKIGGIIDKSGPLMWWAVNHARDYVHEHAPLGEVLDEITVKDLAEGCRMAHKRSVKKAADIGTLIHKWAEKHLAGEEPALPINPHILSGVNAFLAWLEKHDVWPIDSEFKVYDRRRMIAGTGDLDAMVDAKRSMVDFKSSNAIYPEMWIQVAGYAYAREEELGIKYEKFYIIRFPKDGGEFEVHVIGRMEYKKYLQMYKWAYGLTVGLGR